MPIDTDALESELDEVRAVAERALGPNLAIEIHDEGPTRGERRFSVHIVRYDNAGNPHPLHSSGGWDRVSRALLRIRAELEQQARIPGR